MSRDRNLLGRKLHGAALNTKYLFYPSDYNARAGLSLEKRIQKNKYYSLTISSKSMAHKQSIDPNGL